MRVETEVVEEILTPEEKLNGLLGEEGLSGNQFRFMNVTVGIDAAVELRGNPNAYLFLADTDSRTGKDLLMLFSMGDGIKIAQRAGWAAVYAGINEKGERMNMSSARGALFLDRQYARQWIESQVRKDDPDAVFFYHKLEGMAGLSMPGELDGQAMPGAGSMRSVGGRVTQ